MDDVRSAPHAPAVGPARPAASMRTPRSSACRRSGVVDVSVVVVNWNTRDALRTCLESVLRETTDVSFELFVVDNASGDGSAEMVRTRFPAVTLIANAENRGFAAANNQALRVARGRHVLLLNPDTFVVDGAIGRAVRLADCDPSIGALGCQVMVREGEIQRTCFKFPSVGNLVLLSTGLDRVAPASWFGGGPTMKDWDRKSDRDVDVVSGMFLLVRREAMRDVGLMDEAYFVYAEEADWCLRIRRAGWRCAFTRTARIVHEGGGGKATAQAKVRMHVQLQKSLLIFHRKNLGALSFAAAKSIYVVTNAARALLWSGASAFVRRPSIRERRDCAAAALRFHLTGREPAR